LDEKQSSRDVQGYEGGETTGNGISLPQMERMRRVIADRRAQTRKQNERG
jgi:hypothetical protein